MSDNDDEFLEVIQESRGNRVANQRPTDDISEGSLPSFSCELAAWNVTRLSLSELAALRKQPGTRLPAHITPPFLKNSDDQTIASLAAIYSGIETLGFEREAYRDWGVVSASRYIGRGSFAATLHKYCKDGPWGVSVQVIPHNMLHSISSTISLALPCVGPCLGAGGGADGETDALLIAANLLSSGQIPGVWVTWSTWDPELVVDEAGKPASDSHCVATAIALLPLVGQLPRALLEIQLRNRSCQAKSGSEQRVSQTQQSRSITSVLEHVNDRSSEAFEVVCQLRGGLDLNLIRRPSCDHVLAPHSRISGAIESAEAVDRV